MHQQLKRILLFVLGFLLMNTTIYVYFKRISVKNYKVVANDRRFWKVYDGQAFIILGHSRSKASFSDANMFNSIKLCSGGENVVKSYGRFSKIIRKGFKPTAIILPGGYNFVSVNEIHSSIDDFFWSRYIDFNALGKLRKQRKVYMKKWFMAKFFPYDKYVRFRLMLLNNEGIYIREKTYPEANKKERMDMAEKVVKKQSGYSDIDDPVAYYYLEKLIKLAQENNISIVFVDYPVSQEYKTAYTNERKKNGYAVNQLEKWLNEKKYPHVTYLNYSEHFNACDACFKDVQHMSPEGAEKFTAELNKVFEQKFGYPL